MNVFLDLEGTIIDNWFDRQSLPKHINMISHWLQEHNVTHINLLSYAIHSNHTVEKGIAEQFIRWTFPSIQTIMIYSVEDLRYLLMQHCYLLLDEMDFFERFGDKRWLLMTLYRHLSPDDNVIVLIDDSFEQCKIQLINATIEVKRVNSDGLFEEIS